MGNETAIITERPAAQPALKKYALRKDAAASYISVSPEFLEKCERDGKIKARKYGKVTLYLVEELERMVRDGM